MPGLIVAAESFSARYGNDIKAAQAWVNAYYNTYLRDLEKLCDYQTNPNIAVVSGFMCAATDEEAWQKADGWTFFQFALALYNKEGGSRHRPVRSAPAAS